MPKRTTPTTTREEPRRRKTMEMEIETETEKSMDVNGRGRIWQEVVNNSNNNNKRVVLIPAENLVPDKWSGVQWTEVQVQWSEVQVEINIMKKERRKIARELMFGTRAAEKRRNGLPPLRKMNSLLRSDRDGFDPEALLHVRSQR
ncbi:hypothetical protein TIFTF001_035150 [Ficus carica]|uniref:Uncharacterized protein n=1 Tax=Ficus carica TaxID=3494 RepID=A0AA88E491_FICCA|nr:hypothetical protein TIFTF001_035150 [Ficus carica]